MRQELITHAERSWEAICTCLSLCGIEYGVDYTGLTVNNSVMLINYSLEMVNTSKWQKFKQLSDELTQAAQLGKDDKVRVSYTGLDYRIEVPKPRSLHNEVKLTDVFRKSQGLNVSFGVSAYDNTPNAVDFSDNNAGHMLISGSTRCGKTNILKIIALMLMYKNKPDDIRICLIDTEKARGKYGALINSAHLATEILNTRPKVLAFLRWVRDMIGKLEGRKFDKKVIIIIDEMYLLIKNEDGTDNKELKGLLAYIATAGAEVGFHIIAATQYTKVDDIGGPQFKGNMMTSVAGRVKTHYDSLNATGQPGLGAENLMVPGDFLVVDHNGVERIAVPEVFDSYFKNIKRGTSPIMTLNWDEDDVNLANEVPVKTPNIAACFDRIDHRLLHLAINGKHKAGPYQGKPFGADVITKASKVLAKRGLGSSIGNSTAQEYVNFAKKYRGIK